MTRERDRYEIRHLFNQTPTTGEAEPYGKAAVWPKWAALYDTVAGFQGPTNNAVRVSEIVAKVEGKEPVSRQAAEKWYRDPPPHVVRSVARYAATHGIIPPSDPPLMLWNGFEATVNPDRYLEWIKGEVPSLEEQELVRLFRSTDQRGRDSIMAVARVQASA